jgi:hypothetical protein
LSLLASARLKAIGALPPPRRPRVPNKTQPRKAKETMVR